MLLSSEVVEKEKRKKETAWHISKEGEYLGGVGSWKERAREALSTGRRRMRH